MKEFREEFERRRQERRASKSSSWVFLVLKILFFIFVVLLIRYFANPDPRNFRSFRTDNSAELDSLQNRIEKLEK